MANVDLEKLICSFLNPSNETKKKLAEEKHLIRKESGEIFVGIGFIRSLLKHSLKEQGLEFVDGKIQEKIEEKNDVALASVDIDKLFHSLDGIGDVILYKKKKRGRFIWYDPINEDRTYATIKGIVKHALEEQGISVDGKPTDIK